MVSLKLWYGGKAHQGSNPRGNPWLILGDIRRYHPTLKLVNKNGKEWKYTLYLTSFETLFIKHVYEITIKYTITIFRCWFTRYCPTIENPHMWCSPLFIGDFPSCVASSLLHKNSFMEGVRACMQAFYFQISFNIA